MLKVGDIVLARVTGIKDYGFFVKVDGYDGLCHLSEISNDFVENVTDFVKVGDDIYVLIVGIDEKNKKIKRNKSKNTQKNNKKLSKMTIRQND